MNRNWQVGQVVYAMCLYSSEKKKLYERRRASPSWKQNKLLPKICVSNKLSKTFFFTA